MKTIKIIIVSLFLILLNINCSQEPVSGFNFIEKYLGYRINHDYGKMYSLYHSKFKADISFDRFIEFERIYNKKFGQLNKFKLKKWNNRKNFSCGKGSGKLVVITYTCQYLSGNTEEIFTLIKTDDKWRIFDYYLKPIF